MSKQETDLVQELSDALTRDRREGSVRLRTGLESSALPPDLLKKIAESADKEGEVRSRAIKAGIARKRAMEK